MFKPHQTVLSLCGRDKGTYLAVTAVDERYIYVCDGKKRPLDNPKRKNPAHLEAVGTVLDAGSFANDRSLRKALAKTKSEQNKE